MRIFHRLSFQFQDKELEKGYRAVKEENAIKDFNIYVAFYLFTNIISIIMAVTGNAKIQLYISAGAIVPLLIILVIQKYLRRHIQIVTLLMAFYHNIITLFLFPNYVAPGAKTRLFFFGYGFAAIQGILIFRLYHLSHKISAIIFALILRFVYVNCFIEPGSFVPLVFVRQFVIDAFIIYTMCVYEKMLRKIYLNFVQKNEELGKFKELLADSLPQSLVVVHCESYDLLFANNAFQKTFDNKNDTNLTDLIQAHSFVKYSLKSLIVDRTTIRETGNNDSSWIFLDDSKDIISLKEVLDRLRSEGCLINKTISLAASLTEKNNRKLFEITLKKVKWDTNDAIAILFNDITYQENLIALKLANVNKDKVIATVSHELRTPLNGIIGILDIAEQKTGDAKVAEYLSLCKDNAHLLLNLVNSILDLQQISAGKLRLNPSEIDIRGVLNVIVQLFTFQCRQKNITLECNVHSEVPTYIFTDVNRLKQILINLIGNAVKFTSRGGVKIEVISLPVNFDKLQFLVSDTGSGIKEEDQKRLFKMDSRVEVEEGVNKNGAGLGLTISNALVQLLNGNADKKGIKFETKHGVGSKFCFEIEKDLKVLTQTAKKVKITPSQQKIVTTGVSNDAFCDTARGPLIQKMNQPDEADIGEDDNIQEKDFDELFTPTDPRLKLRNYESFTAIKSSEPKFAYRDMIQSDDIIIERGDLKRDTHYTNNNIPRIESVNTYEKLGFDMDILIVDDNPFNLLVAENLFKGLGCRIRTALSGQEAIELAQKSFAEGITFKVIFMDCQMPIMDGFETTKALRLLMKNGEIPESPIYAWTANNSEEDVKKCYEAGMAGHLPKPASKPDIMKVISVL